MVAVLHGSMLPPRHAEANACALFKMQIIHQYLLLCFDTVLALDSIAVLMAINR